MRGIKRLDFTLAPPARLASAGFQATSMTVSATFAHPRDMSHRSRLDAGIETFAAPVHDGARVW